MRTVRRFGCLDGLRHLMALLGRTPSMQRKLPVLILAILSGLTVAVAIVANQPEPSELAQNSPQQPGHLEPATEPPTNPLALPLTKIFVEAAPPTILVRNVKIAQGEAKKTKPKK